MWRQLGVIGVEMRLHAVTLGQVGDIVNVCQKLYRAKDGALGHAAVYGKAFGLVPTVQEWQDLQKYVI